MQEIYDEPRNYIFHGPPGAGRIYSAIGNADSIIEPFFNCNDRMSLVKEYRSRSVLDF
ncbi:MAG: hypothetical protein ACTSVI_08530 [Promethearchaeota archaeon]